MYLTFSEQVRILLDRKDMSVAELAEKIGTTRQNLSNKLKNNSFDIEYMERIANALGTELTIMLTELSITNKNNLPTFSKKKKNIQRNPRQRHAVAQYDLDGNLLATYNGLREAARAIGKQSSAIIECCNGNRQTAYGYVWKKIINDEEVKNE